MKPPAPPITPDSLDARGGRVQRCEPRLALSVTPIAEALLPWGDFCDATHEIDGAYQTDAADATEVQTQSLGGAELDVHRGLPAGAIGLGEPLSTARRLDGTGQTLAVIDSGIAYDHVALGGGFGPGFRVVGGFDFAENDADPYDDGPVGFHGTHVAGIAAGMGVALDGTDLTGVAPGADLVALRVFDDFGRGELAWVESALQWVHDNQDAFENPITTVNLSIGADIAADGQTLSILDDELAALREDNILVFAATGNGFGSLPGDRLSEILYPASSELTVATGSIDSTGLLSQFSQRTDGVLLAPGESITGPIPQHVLGPDGYADAYTQLTGTSQANPQIAAASMLVRQSLVDAGIEPTADAILGRLRGTAIEVDDPLTGTTSYRIDIDAAIAGPAGGAIPTTVAPASRWVGLADSETAVLDVSDPAAAFLTIGDRRIDLVVDASGQIQLDAGGGGDSLRIVGGPASEMATLRPGDTSTLRYPGGEIQIGGFETIAITGGGGSDRVAMHDSAGNDVFRGGNATATLSGAGFSFKVDGFDHITTHSTGAGNDTVHFSDTAGDDRLAIRPGFSSIRGSGKFVAAFGFDRVTAYATAGGIDTADLADSSGDDVMSISTGRATISSHGYRASAIGFDNITAEASRGGMDTVNVYVDAPGGTWHSTDTLTQWNGADGTRRIARGFEVANTHETFAGNDAAQRSVPTAVQSWQAALAELDPERAPATQRSSLRG